MSQVVNPVCVLSKGSMSSLTSYHALGHGSSQDFFDALLTQVYPFTL